MFPAIPWIFYEVNTTRFWVHYGLVITGFVLAVITAIVQFRSPAPYGKHDTQDVTWGPAIPQRLGHIISDGIPGIVLFVLVFFLYGSSRGYANIVFLIIFLLHYVHRGLIHPLVMRYRKPTVSLGISLGGLFPNMVYHFVNADMVGSALYIDIYYYDPRFIIGLMLFVLGFIINRWADLKLRSLRSSGSEYYIPYGGLFELVTCPNYLGEWIQWLGWSIATWSLAGLAWTFFAASTFIPRAKHNHNWYRDHFEFYPPNRKALIPYVY